MNLDTTHMKNWRCTGFEIPVRTQYTEPPGDNGDRYWRSLMAHCIGLLYTFVGSAQHHPVIKDDDEKHAVQQLVIASAAIAASEADAFLTLVSAGLEHPAEIHLRSIGENARRAVMCRECPTLAKELYDSAEPSWRAIASSLPVPNAPAFDKKTETVMRNLENQPRFQEAREKVMKKAALLSPFLWSMWSKRSHGDIFSLIQVARKLTMRGPDVRQAVNSVGPFDLNLAVMLQSATGFTIAMLVAIGKQFQIDAVDEVNNVIEQYGKLQERDKPLINAKLEEYRRRHN